MITKMKWLSLLPLRSGIEAGDGPPRGWAIVATAISTLFLATCFPLVHAQNVTLDSISYSSLPGERVRVHLSLSEPAKEPLSFAIDDPARVALDFPGVTVNLPRKTQTIGVGMARSVTAVEAGGRTRVVLNLIKLVPYTMEVSGRDVILTLEGGQTTQSRDFIA